MLKPTQKAECYEVLGTLNQHLNEILLNLDRLRAFRIVHNKDLKDLVVFIEEARAWANLPIVEGLQICEENDWGHFYQLRAQSERKFRERPENHSRPETGSKPSPVPPAQGDLATSPERKKK
jgi:hypothetical protein